MKKQSIILYHTLGCHLCDEAVVLAAQIIHAEQLPIQIELVDIVHDDALLSRYATSIPVFKYTRQQGDNVELSYPFDRKTLADWLKSA